MFRGTAYRKIEVLKAIDNGIYSNVYVASKLGLTAMEINYDKQTLYKNDYIDRGFDDQVWVLTDKGEETLKNYFKPKVPSPELKMEILKHLYFTDKPLCHLGNTYEDYKGRKMYINKYHYHKRWLVKNGYVNRDSKRGTVTKKGLDAIKYGFQEGI